MAAVGGGAAGIEEGHRFVFVLHHDGYVVAVVPLTVLLKLKTATDAPDVFWLGFGEPADEVDVVDAHVEELAATPFGEFEGALDRGDRVDGVAADHDYAADFTAVDAGFGIEIGGVETAHETEHEDLVRIGFDGLFRESALSDVGTERFSENTCLPFSSAMRICSGCREDGETMTMASSSGFCTSLRNPYSGIQRQIPLRPGPRGQRRHRK